jgi:hypothetical protein
MSVVATAREAGHTGETLEGFTRARLTGATALAAFTLRPGPGV